MKETQSKKETQPKKRKPASILFVLAYGAALYAFTFFILTPWVKKIAASDLFLKETDDIAQAYPISNPLTDMAILHCNVYVRDEIDETDSLTFVKDDSKVWTLGDYRYIVKSSVDVVDQAGASSIKQFACQIKYEDGDETNIDNWDFLGLNIY